MGLKPKLGTLTIPHPPCTRRKMTYLQSTSHYWWQQACLGRFKLSYTFRWCKYCKVQSPAHIKINFRYLLTLNNRDPFTRDYSSFELQAKRVLGKYSREKLGLDSVGGLYSGCEKSGIFVTLFSSQARSTREHMTSLQVLKTDFLEIIISKVKTLTF